MFNLEKQYGNTYKTDGILEAFLYTVCTLIIISSSITMTYIGIHKTAHIVGINQQSVKEMNSKICRYLNQKSQKDRNYPNYHRYIQSCNQKTKYIDPFLDYSIASLILKIENDEYCRQVDCNLSYLEDLKKDILIYYHYLDKFLPLFSPQNRQKQIKIKDNPQKYLKEIDERIQNDFFVSVRDTAIHINELSQFSSVYHTYGDIYDFIMNDDVPSNLSYDFNLLFHIYFVFSGILILIVIKYSSWINFLWIALYILILLILLTLFAFFVNTLKLDIFPDLLGFSSYSRTYYSDILSFIFLLTLLISNLSLKLTKVKKIKNKNFEHFCSINFFTLPIAITFTILFSFAIISNEVFNADLIFWRESIKFLSWLFFLYLCSFPLQKKVLKRFMSLPKE